jgi:hypothetical protein
MGLERRFQSIIREGDGNSNRSTYWAGSPLQEARYSILRAFVEPLSGLAGQQEIGNPFLQTPNKIRGIYNRAAYWSERVRLMQHWANRLDCPRKGVAVPLRKSA